MLFGLSVVGKVSEFNKQSRFFGRNYEFNRGCGESLRNVVYSNFCIQKVKNSTQKSYCSNSKAFKCINGRILTFQIYLLEKKIIQKPP